MADDITVRMMDKLRGELPSKLRLVVEGKLGQIPFDTFATMARNSCDILAELDSAVSLKPRGTIEWVLSGVFANGSVTIAVDAKPKGKETDFSTRVAEYFVDGLAHIQKHGTTPPYFSGYGLRKTQSIAKALQKNGATGIRVDDVIRNVSGLIEADTAENLGRLINIQYEEQGSVEGTLEMISVHRTPRLTLYHSVTRRSVSCRFAPSLLDSAKDGLGNRVIVRGTVFYNFVHEPVKVDATGIELMPNEKDLPTAKDLRGMTPDFTGDMKTEDYVRSLRE